MTHTKWHGLHAGAITCKLQSRLIFSDGLTRWGLHEGIHPKPPCRSWVQSMLSRVLNFVVDIFFNSCVWDPVHANAFSFEKLDISMRFCLWSTLTVFIMINKKCIDLKTQLKVNPNESTYFIFLEWWHHSHQITCLPNLALGISLAYVILIMKLKQNFLEQRDISTSNYKLKIVAIFVLNQFSIKMSERVLVCSALNKNY